MNKCILLFAVFIFSVSTSYAQSSWQWGKRGGTPEYMIGYGPSEDINDITTDKWGNIYVVASVAAFDISIGSEPVTIPLSYSTVPDICIASYKCDGTLRWFKMIVASQDNEGFAVKTDTLGGVYVIGRMIITFGSSPNKGYIQNNTVTDTVIAPFSGNKTMFLMKLDTGGAYKWLRMPEPDTLTPVSTISGFIDMDVDEDGNIYSLCELKPGAYADGSFVAKDTAGWNIWNNDGEYVLKYNKDGVFQGGFHLPIGKVGTDGAVTFIKRDAKRHRFYVSGGSIGFSSSDTLFVGGTSVYSMYVACFSDAGELLWLKHDNPIPDNFGFPKNRPALDRKGNVYIAGMCDSGFNFNGSPFPNSLGGTEESFLVKLDTNGNNVWATNGSNNDVSSAVGVAVSEDTVAVFGYESCTEFSWGTYTIGGTFLRSYLARFNVNTGNVIGIDTINHDPLNNCQPGSGGGFLIGTTGTVGADRFGNFYCGGSFSSRIYVAGDTITTVGGDTDWFIAKFGTNNCSVPISSLATTNSATHDNVTIYPNPVMNDLIVENAETGSSVRIFNVLGQLAYAGMVCETKQVISMKELLPGNYILEIIDLGGNRVNKIMVKQ